MKRKPITAGELGARLDKDPVYQEMLRKKDEQQAKRVREIEADSRDVIAALGAQGIRVEHLDEVLQPQFVPLPLEIVELLMGFLRTFRHPSNQEWAVRVIGATRVPYDARPLAVLFDSCTSEDVKWVIGNTLSITRPLGVDEWIFSALLDRSHGSGRQMLCDAAVRQNPARARLVLRELIEEMPLHALSALGRCGGPEELVFLRQKLETCDEWIARAEQWCAEELKAWAEAAVQKGRDPEFWDDALKRYMTQREQRSRAACWKKRLEKAINSIERRCARVAERERKKAEKQRASPGKRRRQCGTDSTATL